MPVATPTTSPARTVLFVCEYNACRSQLAEGIALNIVPAGWRVLSAGLVATQLSDEVAAALREIGVDHSASKSKSIESIDADVVDDAIVLAAPAIEPTRARFRNARIHEWPMDDPMRATGGPNAVHSAVRFARTELLRRIDRWVHDVTTEAVAR